MWFFLFREEFSDFFLHFFSFKKKINNAILKTSYNSTQVFCYILFRVLLHEAHYAVEKFHHVIWRKVLRVPFESQVTSHLNVSYKNSLYNPISTFHGSSRKVWMELRKWKTWNIFAGSHFIHTRLNSIDTSHCKK